MIKAFLFAAALLVVPATSAQAGMTCNGDQNFVSCSGSEYDFQSGKTIYCTASGHPDFLNWTCSSY